MHADCTLRETLEGVLVEHPILSSVRHLVNLTTRIALVYLRQKARSGRLQPAYHGLSLDDLALDCCAELFERDTEGRFPVLCSYFEAIGWREKRDVELQMALRRITFSKTNEELFRRNRELDSNLAKVIRNIKDGVKLTPQVRLERYGHENWLVVGAGEPLHTDRPGIPPEFLEAYLTSAIKYSMQVREAIGALVAFVQLWPAHQNGISLIVFAQQVRSVFNRLGCEDVEELVAEEQRFSADEVVCAIETALEVVRAKMALTYVRNRKVDESTFTLYVNAVRSILEAQYVYDTLSEYSYFDIVSIYDAGISEEEYREQHRNKIEYMVKLTRAQVGTYLWKAAHERPPAQA